MIVGKREQVAAWLFGLPEDAVVEAKVRRRRRSTSQNALYWELLGQLAAVLGTGHGELHRHMVLEHGPYAVCSVRDDVPLDAFFRYYRVVGRGRANGRDFVHVRVHKGSSEMDGAEFSRLLDGLIAECEAQGVHTAGPWS